MHESKVGDMAESTKPKHLHDYEEAIPAQQEEIKLDDSSVFGQSFKNSGNLRDTRSKSVMMKAMTDKSNRMTSFKSKHLELSERLSDGFLGSARSSGFNLVIDFADLHFSQKNDLIASGGYGDVYKGKWLGLTVAVKKFGKKYINKKALKELVKEIEVLHSLRHPYIVLYLGVSFDKYNSYYMVTEYVSKGSLFHILHKKNLVLSEMKSFTIAKQIGK